MYQAEVFISGLPTINLPAKTHWRYRQREKKLWEELVWAAFVHCRPLEPLSSADLTLERRSSASREPDYDNLVWSFKNVFDGLVKAGVIEDDKPSVIGRPDIRWRRVPRGSQGVRIHVAERQAA